MESPGAGHIQAELDALTELAALVIDGQNLSIDDLVEFEEAGTKVTVMTLRHNLRDYMLTIEDSSGEMILALRSMEIDGLHIRLPAPLYVGISQPLAVGGYC